MEVKYERRGGYDDTQAIEAFVKGTKPGTIEPR